MDPDLLRHGEVHHRGHHDGSDEHLQGHREALLGPRDLGGLLHLELEEGVVVENGGVLAHFIKDFIIILTVSGFI